MENYIHDLLKKGKLRKTQCRYEVLSLFLQNNRALSHADIEQNIDKTTDRVTIYRTLRTFLDCGLLHKVLDDSGSLKYALCKDCPPRKHHHEHLHFKCLKCDRTICIEEVEIPAIKLPKGYKIIESNLLVQGICPNCTLKN